MPCLSASDGAARRTLLGICLTVGGSFTVLASFNYLLTPMLADLGLTQAQASVALAIPPIASLLIVFLAGRLGDSRGHRTVMLWMSVAFITGSLIVAIAQGLPAVVVGLLVEGIAATAIQIIGIGLLSDSFPEPRGRASAFGTFGMVSPAVWLCLPVLTGWIVGEASWRWVPLMWAVIGVVMLVATLTLLPRPTSTSAVGEIVTPVLAGATVATAVQWLNRVGDEGVFAPVTLLTLAITITLAVSCAVLMRRLPAPAFSLAPLRVGRARSLLAVVIIIPLINTVFLMTIAFQYLYGLTVLQTALVMVPAQAAAVLGTRFIAGPLMRRIGVTHTAMLLFAVLSIAMLGVFAIAPSSPLWVPIAYVTVYNLLTVTASITVTSAVLTSAPDIDSGQLSAYRGSAQALGGVLAVVVMNGAVFTLARLFMSAAFQANGLTQDQAAAEMATIQASATSTDVMSEYAVPLPSGVQISDVMSDSIATGLHVNGVLGVLLAIACVLLLRSGARRRVSAG